MISSRCGGLRSGLSKSSELVLNVLCCTCMDFEGKPNGETSTMFEEGKFFKIISLRDELNRIVAIVVNISLI